MAMQQPYTELTHSLHIAPLSAARKVTAEVMQHPGQKPTLLQEGDPCLRQRNTTLKVSQIYHL